MARSVAASIVAHGLVNYSVAARGGARGAVRVAAVAAARRQASTRSAAAATHAVLPTAVARGAARPAGAGRAGARRLMSAEAEREVASAGRADWYGILGVEREATAEEIRGAYHKLAKKHHPDVAGATGDAELLHRVNEAYRILSNETLRGAYDRRSTSRAAALKVKNEGNRGRTFDAEAHHEASATMHEARSRLDQRNQRRGASNRARREKVHVPTTKQTYWRMLVPLSVVALYAFNHVVFKTLNPERKVDAALR
uniref:J domain-containing protein n=1 Tax=Bicosoecida sp. CB-2014 TaxID=1486930 RepID=A0A7S1GF81_9STRA